MSPEPFQSYFSLIKSFLKEASGINYEIKDFQSYFSLIKSDRLLEEGYEEIRSFNPILVWLNQKL